METETIQILQEKLALEQKKLKLIMDIDHIRDTSPEPMAMLASIVNLLAKGLAADFCLLSLLNEETDDVELKVLNDLCGKFGDLNQTEIHNLAKQTLALDEITIWHGEDVLPDQNLSNLQLAAVPIIMGDNNRLGALLLARFDAPFSPDDIELLSIAEDQIDSAVIQGRLHYQMKQHLKELETIYRIDHIRDRGLPFDEMLNVVLQELGSTLEVEMGFIMLYDQAGEQLEMRATTHSDLMYVSNYYQLVKQVAEDALEAGKLLCRNNLSQALRAVMTLPLTFNNRVIGVLGVANHYKHQEFNAEDRRLLSAIGSQIDTAIFESLEKRHMRQVLGRSVDPRVMERLLADSDADFLKGERMVLTVLYADIRGSTLLAEQTDPELLVGFVNDYLGSMTDVILAHEGTLDKFVGDEVMALFGAPYPLDDHALRGVQVGLAMQEAHQDVMARWQKQGVKAAPIGVGLATGELIVGEMGSSRRTDYTAIGRAANLGARICSAAKGGQVLISQTTYDMLKDKVEAVPISGMEFKGVVGGVTVYDVKRVL